MSVVRVTEAKDPRSSGSLLTRTLRHDCRSVDPLLSYQD
jgi:hypothetical protein